jgi:hypothetical protein
MLGGHSEAKNTNTFGKSVRVPDCCRWSPFSIAFVLAADGEVTRTLLLRDLPQCAGHFAAEGGF